MTRARVDVFLAPGQLTVHRAPVSIKTILGSCVAVCLWDQHGRAGGMNHYLLPTPPGGGSADNRFGSVATPRLIHGLTRCGPLFSELRAAVVGGGHPVGALHGATVGDDNVAIALEILRQHGIRIVRQETGGAFGRKVLFTATGGRLLVRRLKGWPVAEARPER